MAEETQAPELSPQKRLKSDDVNREEKHRPCPICKSHLVFRTGTRGNFWGCSRYPICNGYTDLNGFLSAPVCGKCGGMFVARKNHDQDWWGCGKWPVCKNSLKWDEGIKLMRQQAKKEACQTFSTTFNPASQLLGASLNSELGGNSSTRQLHTLQARELKQLLDQQSGELRAVQLKHVQQLLRLQATHQAQLARSVDSRSLSPSPQIQPSTNSSVTSSFNLSPKNSLSPSSRDLVSHSPSQSSSSSSVASNSSTTLPNGTSMNGNRSLGR